MKRRMLFVTGAVAAFTSVVRGAAHAATTVQAVLRSGREIEIDCIARTNA